MQQCTVKKSYTASWGWYWPKDQFSRSEWSEKDQIWVFATFANFLKNKRRDNFLIVVYTASWDQLSRDGLDWIILRVISKVGKVKSGPFSHNHWYYSVVAAPHLLHHVSSLVWNQSYQNIWNVWNHSKGYFQSQKGPIWTFVVYLS